MINQKETMNPDEAKAYITWFRNNHLPKGVDFIRTNLNNEIMLDSLDDEEAVFVAHQFELMLEKATKKS